MPKLLSDSEVNSRLGKLKGWEREGLFICKTFEFKTFMDGIRFLSRVAKVAEAQQHHPDIDIRYSQVKLLIQTHSEGGLTSWDFSLAREIDKIDV